jgi:hypothetical protein
MRRNGVSVTCPEVKNPEVGLAATRLAARALGISTYLGYASPPDRFARCTRHADRVAYGEALRRGRGRAGSAYSAMPPSASNATISNGSRARRIVLSVRDDLFVTFGVASYTAEHFPGACFVGYFTDGHVWSGYDRELPAPERTAARLADTSAG